MKTNVIRILYCLSALVITILVLDCVAFAEEVNGYEELFKMLPGGMQQRAANEKEIQHGQEFVVSRQEKKKREVDFIKPTEVFRLNKKYISISFDMLIQTKRSHQVSKTTGVFALLFETVGNNGIKFSKGYYLSWIGSKDVANYLIMDVKQFCKYFRDAGATDCNPDKLTAFRIEKSKIITRDEFVKAMAKKADINHTHDGADIISGKVDYQYLNNAANAEVVTKDLEELKNVTQQGKIAGQETVDELKMKVKSLEQTVKHLEALLKGVTRKGNDIIFSNVNVQLINGKGTTESKNGTGNFIVGYNEGGTPNKSSGSHNIVVGSQHSYTSFGGIVAGTKNSITGKYASIIGGTENLASGELSTVVGGKKNKASGQYANVSGGVDRTVSGTNPHFNK